MNLESQTREENKMFKKRHIYKALKISNDINAIKKGKVGKRIKRRVAGKYAGKGLGKLFK